MKKIGILIVGMFLGVGGNAWAVTAKAEIRGTTPESKISGVVTFQETPDGLLVQAQISGATPGVHGFHIHEKGSCGNQGNDAGAHFNPLGAKHGFFPKDGLEGAHLGDLGNIQVAGNGKGVLKYDHPIPKLRIRGGQYNIEGRAVIIHERPDDLSQPSGNAGARIGCGVIQVTD